MDKDLGRSFRYTVMLTPQKLALLFVVIFSVSPNVFAETNGEGGNLNTDGDRAKTEIATGCQIAGAGRLVLDTAAHNCQPGENPVIPAPMPNDSGDCSSPKSDGKASQPIKYELGAKAPMSGNGPPPVPSQLDCSGDASLTMCRAGIKWATSGQGSKPCENLNTGDMMKIIGTSNSCLKSIPAGNAGSNLMPGDMIVYTHSGESIGHVFWVNSVDKDKHCFSINQAAGGSCGVGIVSYCGGSTPTGGDQGEALQEAKKVNDGAASDAKGKIKVVRVDSSNPNCTFQSKPFPNEAKCDVGEMKDHND